MKINFICGCITLAVFYLFSCLTASTYGSNLVKANTGCTLDSSSNDFGLNQSLLFNGTFTNKHQDQNVSFSNIGISEKYMLCFQHHLFEYLWSCNLRYDLGFTYFIDSLWMKNRDKIELNIIGQRTVSNKLKPSITMLFVSNIFSEKVKYLKSDGSVYKFQSGGLLNPGFIQLAYGFSYGIDSQNYLNCSIATIRMQWKKSDKENDNIVPDTKQSNLKYGLGIDANFKISLIKSVEYSSSFHFFANSFERNSVRILSNNYLKISITNCLSVLIDSEFEYDLTKFKNGQLITELELSYIILNR